MFEIDSKKIEEGKQNSCKEKHISLDKNLDCFILISGNNNNFIDLTIKNILDYIIDKITLDNTYTEFSIALENINSFIKTWKIDSDKKIKLDVFIGILQGNNFMFSNIGEASCYLLKKNNELLELTSKPEKKQEFSFISNGDLQNDEIVILSNKKLLDYLTVNDLIDGLDENKNIKIFNKNISDILSEEILEENIQVTSLKYSSHIEEELNNNQLEKVKNIGNKIIESKIFKKTKKKYNKIKKKLKTSSKNVKNIIFLIGIIVSLFLIYNILSTIIGVSTQNENKQIAVDNLSEAKSYIRIASENIGNPDNFELNIKNAEEIIKNVTSKKMLISDIEKINDDIDILKKQFNKIEIFDDLNNEILYAGDLQNGIKIIKNNKKPYIVNKKGVFGPILPNTTPKNYIFTSLESNEEFVDATILGTDIILLTNFSKVVKFTSNGHFAYSDVIGQTTWEKAKEIKSYGQNIYLLGKQDNQILKHSKNGNKFNASKHYLKKDDLTQIGEILSIAIDGGFYILKKDLSIIKFFSSPKYRLEKISLNKLPKNYNHDEDSKIELKARTDLNYVYLLMNNKIWVFKPNTNNYSNTKSLTYIGQIEGKNYIIEDFYINHDGEVLVLNKEGIYKINFEISDDRLIIR